MYFTQRARLRLNQMLIFGIFLWNRFIMIIQIKQLHRMILLTCHRIFILAITGQDASYPQHRMKAERLVCTCWVR